MTRRQANQTILQMLNNQIEKNPDIRFHQLLQNTGLLQVDYVIDLKKHMEIPVVLDNFYEESEVSLERLKKAIYE